MKAEQIIDLLTDKQVLINLTDGELSVEAAKGVLTRELIELLRNNKKSLVAYLQEQSSYQPVSGAEFIVSKIPRSGSAHFPLSFAQQRLWFIDQFQGGSANYNIPVALQVTGQFSPQIAEQALQEIVKRHEVLRTIYRSVDDCGVQIIQASPHCPLSVIDLTNLSGQTQLAEVQRLIYEDADEVFDLTQDVMLRASWLVQNRKPGSEKGVLLFNMHHIASDGWSIAVLIREFVTLYQALDAGQPNPLPPLAIQYVDYASSQRDYLQTEVLQTQLDYWIKQLAGVAVVHDLPLDFTRPPQMAFQGEMVTGQLSAEVAKQISQFALEQGVTPFMLLHAAFSLLLLRHSNNPDVVIGTPVANRMNKALENLIGFFVNTLVLRSNSADSETFLDYLAHIAQVNLEAQEHQDIPFERLVEKLDVSRNMQHSPLVQIVLSMNTNEQEILALEGLDFSEMESEKVLAKFDLLLDATVNDKGVKLNWTYDTALFKRSSVERLNRHLMTLLSSIVNHPEVSLAQLTMLSEKESHYLLHTLNDRQTNQPTDKLIHEVFMAQARLNPDRIAVVFEGQRLTYRELDERTNQLAHYLREQGVGIETLVGIAVDRSLEMILGILAILKAGGAYVPLDPGYPKNRLEYMMADSKITLLLTQSHFIAQFGQENIRCFPMDIMEVELSTYAKEVPGKGQQTSASLAYVIYTSGSTGQPKGVLVEHSNVVRLFSATESDFHFDQNDVWALFHSYAFDFSVWEMWGALLYGGRLVVVPYWSTRSPVDFYQLLQAEQVTVLNQTPSAFNQLIEVDNQQQADLALRYVVFGGEALNFAALVPWVEHHGDQVPALINMYGITETTVHVTYRQVLKQDIVQQNNLSLIGRPLSDLTSYLLTPDQQLTPFGAAGELYIGGGGVTRGYLNQRGLTDQRFIANPFIPGERIYHTGDLARYHVDGDLEYLGRSDSQVKIRGFRIELSEICASLLKHEAVQDALITVRDVPQRLVAYIVSEKASQEVADKSILRDTLRSYLKTQLPEHMVPSTFVILDIFPLTVNGKIDTKALPEPDSAQFVNQYVAPTTAIEGQLCEVWQTMLELEKVGVTDNFFTIGGDSIRAISVVSRGNEAGLNYSIKDLFHHQTIENLARAIDKNQTQVQTCADIPDFSLLNDRERLSLSSSPGKELMDDAYPLSRLQQGMIFHNLMENDAGTYHDVFSFKLKLHWHEEKFTQALDALISRHNALRSIFQLNQERPLQLIYRFMIAPLSVIDITGLKSQDQSRVVGDWRENEKTVTFDFSKPLWSVVVHRLKDDEFYFHLSFHHALLDGWSVASLNTELFERYQALLTANETTLMVKPLSYRNFVALEQEAMGSVEEKSYWLNKLAGAQSPWWGTTLQGESVLQTWEISQSNSIALMALAEILGVQEKSVLLSIHLVMLSWLSGSDDVVTSVVYNGRPEAEGSDKTLGLFLNSLPFRLQGYARNWSGLIKAIDQQLIELVAHRHYPLSEIQKLTNMDYSASIFNFVDFHVYNKIADDVNLLAIAGFEQINYLFQTFISKKPLSNQLLYTIKADQLSFGEAFLKRIRSSIDRMIDELLADHEQNIHWQNFLDAEEVNNLLNNWNNLDSDVAEFSFVHQLFENQVVLSPNAIAVRYNDQQLSYTELNQKANQLAHYLIEAGITAGMAIGLCIPRSIPMVVAVLGILKAGAGYVPLEPDLPEERMKFILVDAGIELLLTDANLLVKLAIDNMNCLLLDDVMDATLWLPQYADYNPSTEVLELTPGHMAYVIYTSGSSGQPKGVITEHQNLGNYLQHCITTYAPGTAGAVVSTSLSFDATVTSLFTPLLSSGHVCLVSQQSLEIEHLANVFKTASEPLLFKMTPAHLQALLPLLPDFSSQLTHKLVIGGEQLTSALLHQWRSTILPGAIYINEYGPTEVTVGCSVSIINSDKLLDETRSAIPIGCPINNTALYVLGSAHQLMPVGSVGELYIGGSGVARGYLNRDSLTDLSFIENPFAGTDNYSRLYRTGDLVCRLAGGELEYCGRVDDQVKIRGFRVELGEIEHQLSLLPGVRSSVILVREEQHGQKQLVAYIVCEEAQGSLPSGDAEREWVEQLRHSLSKRLPGHMIPGLIVVMQELPLTSNGKIDRKALLNKANTQLQTTYVAPETATEAVLVGIWSELLKLGDKKLSITANIFELGGDSILSIQAVARATQAGLKLTVKQLMEHQTIRELALVASATETETIPQEPVTGVQALLPIQRWLFTDETDLHHYNQSVLLTVPADFEFVSLSLLVEQLYLRHDALRLRFTKKSGQWQAQYLDFDRKMLDQSIEHQNLRGSDFGLIEERANSIQSSFSFSGEPLFKAVLFSNDNSNNRHDDQRLLLVLHHLLVDGVSWRIILEDAERLLGQLAGGQSLSLPAKSSSYQKWGEYLIEYANTEVLLTERDYWVEQLSQPVVPFTPEMQLDPRAKINVGVTGFNLSPSMTEKLLKQSNQAYRTQINELLLSAVLLGVNQWSGHCSLQIDLEAHGRETLSADLDLSQSVGWFTSVYPLVISSDAMDIPSVICAVKESHRSVPANGIGFGLLKYLVGDEAVLQLPESGIIFNYLGQFDQVVNKQSSFGVVDEPKGRDVSPRRQLSHGLSFNGMVNSGQLRFELSFDNNRFDADSIATLIASLQAALDSVINHCISPGVGCLTPVDFPLAHINQTLLNEWQEHLDITDIYPATGMQQGLLFHSALDTSAYVTQKLVTLEAGMNMDIFREAWQHIITRHDIFRTMFVAGNESELQQLVLKQVDLPWREIDLNEYDLAGQQRQVALFRQRDLSQGFDAECAPLMRITEFKLAQGRTQLLWSHHHALLDGWSSPLVFAEVIECYRVLMEGGTINLSPAVQFREYITWLNDQDHEEAMAFWQQELSGIEGPTPLPFSLPLPDVSIQPGIGLPEKEQPENTLPESEEQGMNLVLLSFSEQETGQLNSLAMQSRATVNVVLQGAWAYLLSQYSAEDGVIFGTTVSGRPAVLDGVEQMIGLFINTIPAQIRVDRQLPVCQWLAQLRHSLINRDEYSYLPLTNIQRAAGQVMVDTGNIPLFKSTPLFKSILIFENYPVDEALADQVNNAQIAVSSVESFEQTTYDLTLVASMSNELKVRLEYQKSCLSEGQVKRLANHLKNILLSMAQDPEITINKLSMYGSTETEHLLYALNDNACDYPKDLYVHQWFENQVVKTPDEVAVIFESGQLNYNQLNQQANQLAHYLRDLGVSPNSLVGICTEPSAGMLVAMLAVLKAGGAYVPLDPDYPRQRLDYMVEDSAIEILLTQSALSLTHKLEVKNIICLDSLFDLEQHDPEPQSAQVFSKNNLLPFSKQGSDNLAYVIYTSGSTGRPKGVLIEHQSTLNLTQALHDKIGFPGMNWLLLTPFTFDISFFEWFGALSTGARCIIASKESQQDPFRLGGFITESGIDLIQTTPSRWQQLLDAGWQPKQDLTMLTGGEPLTIELQARLLKHGKRVYNCYGPTEATVWSAVNQIDVGQDVDSRLSIGYGLNGYQHYVARIMPEGETVCGTADLVPFGATGELYIGGVSVGRGYLNRPDLTAKHFIVNPFETATDKSTGTNYLYRTGDLVRYLPDGKLGFIGRVDHQVKIRGYRIELGEIENYLLQLDNVATCAVLATEYEPGNKQLVAYVTTNSGAQGTDVTQSDWLDYLRHSLKNSLPEYMVPTLFMVLHALPLTANGKIDKNALPAADGTLLQGEYKAPTTQIESRLVELWAEILKLDIDKISIMANFFELGGHSLLIVRLQSAVSKAFSVDLGIRQVFDYPRLFELAEVIATDKDKPAQRPPITAQIGDDNCIPLSYAQQRMWYMACFEESSAQYNMAMIMRFAGELDITALERALQTVINRHAPLRTVVTKTDDADIQVIKSPVVFKLERQDITQLQPGEQTRRLRELADEVAVAPFDLTNDMMVRAMLVDVQEQQWIMLVTVHHIAFDFQSQAIFEQEVSLLYDRYSRGLSNPLEPLSVQYADYVLWQREWLQGEILQQHLDFWQHHLQGAPKLITLPVDRPRPAVQAHVGLMETTGLTTELSQKIQAYCNQDGCTPFMLLFTAFNVLLSRYAGQENIVVGVPVANRPHPELEKVIGLFVNTLAVHNRINNRETFRHNLSLVKQRLLSAFAHQDTPLESVIQSLSPERNITHTPLFQVFFNMLNSSLAVQPDIGNELIQEADDRVNIVAEQINVPIRTDLDFTVNAVEGHFELSLNYNNAIFDVATIKAMLARYTLLLEEVMEAPDRPLEEFELMLSGQLPVEQLFVAKKLPEATEAWPLSYHQERLLFIDEFETGTIYQHSPTYHNIPLFIHLEKELDPEVLEQSLQILVDKHEVLRSAFVQHADQRPQQQLRTEAKISFSCMDVAGNDYEDLFKAALMQQARPFDVKNGLLIRAALLSNVERGSLLVIIVHHLIADKRMMALLAKQLSVVYGALVQNSAIPELYEGVSYQQYAAWQKQLDKGEFEPMLYYWRRQLSGRLEALKLPESRLRAAIHVFTPGCKQFSISSQATDVLKKLSQDLEVDRFVVFLAAFKLLLSRYSGLQEIVVGNPAPLPEKLAEDLTIGPYSNLVVLRSHLQPAQLFSELVTDLSKTFEKAYANSEMPFDELVRLLDPEKDMSRTALFDVLVDYRQGSSGGLDFASTQGQVINTALGYGKYDIHLELLEVDDQVSCEVVYNLEIYDDSFIEQLFGHYLILLDEVIAQPQRGLVEYQFLNLTQQEQQLQQWTNHDIAYPLQTIDALFAQKSLQFCDRIAITDGEHSIYYSELDCKANQFAHFLVENGVALNTAVGLFLDHSIDMVVAILGILKAGGFYVPVGTSYPISRVEYTLANAGVALLISDSRYHGLLDKFNDLSVIYIDQCVEEINQQPNHGMAVSSPHSLCYCIYTSGTTGQPKGVMLEHHNIVRLLFNDQALFDFSEQDVWTLFHSYCFDFSVWEMYGALLTGGRLVIVPDSVRKDQAEFLKLLQKEKVTVLNQTPSAFYELARVSTGNNSPEISLRWVIFGGEALSTGKLQSWSDAHPQINLVNMYGITEIAVHATYKLITGEDIEKNLPVIGQPIPTLSIYILDDQKKLLPIGVAGEMYVGGAGVARGYLNNSVLTSEKFIKHPFSDNPQDRLYRSGDLARWTEIGELEYLGRCDEQVKIRGFRIEPGEIEQQLLILPEVESSVVLAREDKPGQKYLVAYVILNRDNKGVDGLRKALGKALPEYMVPAFFVILDQLPINNNGKVAKEQLPSPQSLGSQVEYVAPRDPLEESLVEIWKSLLELDRVSIHDNFFHLGGHSLLCARLQSRIQMQINIEITLVDLFQLQSVAELSEHIREKQCQLELIEQIGQPPDPVLEQQAEDQEEEEFLL